MRTSKDSKLPLRVKGVVFEIIQKDHLWQGLAGLYTAAAMAKRPCWIPAPFCGVHFLLPISPATAQLK